MKTVIMLLDNVFYFHKFTSLSLSLSLSLSPSQAYKEKYIILRNSADHKCKVVEIQDSEDGDDTRETVKLNDTWIVQDKPSKSRAKYTFEVSF